MNILAVGLIIVACLSLAAWSFFRFTLRDPERTAPAEDNVIASPADGQIKYIKRIEQGTIPYSEKDGRRIPILESTKMVSIEEGYLIGIWMSFFVVHVQRVPISGVVDKQNYHASGKFLDPHFQDGAEYQNERNIVVIRSDKLPAPVIVVQIASIMVRRIISYLEEKMVVKIGDRMGLIRFGSQVDIVIPANDSMSLTVTVGDRVTAGESIIAKY